ncbi:MAG: zinc ribbon domain-containing protein [Armatimonadota bacterium]
MATITCPQCGVEGTVDDAMVGRRLKCAQCGTSFLVEAPSLELVMPVAGQPLPADSTLVTDTSHGDDCRNSTRGEHGRTPKKAGCGGFFGIVVILVVGFFLIRGCIGCAGKAFTGGKTLTGRVYYEAGTFTIINEDDFDWRNAEFFFNGDRKCLLGVVPADGMLLQDTAHWEDRGHRVFNPDGYASYDVEIRCKEGRALFHFSQ